jgi:hypothetical protein
VFARLIKREYINVEFRLEDYGLDRRSFDEAVKALRAVWKDSVRIIPHVGDDVVGLSFLV